MWLSAALALSTLPTTDLVAWRAMSTSAPGTYTKTVTARIPWDELVVSWNVRKHKNATLTITASLPGHPQSYVLGIWSDNPENNRGSVNKQANDQARVLTDTLVLKQPTSDPVTLTFQFSEPDPHNEITLATASFSRGTSPNESQAEPHPAWGRTLDVPLLRQMDYPNGNVICSPTSLSMVINFWANRLERSDLAVTVPEACAGVMDPNWPGTGNWPFNTAFAGSRPGLRAYIARWQSLRDLETWIAHGWPVITSVSYDLLKGKPEKGPNDGHIVVLVGFTPDGQPIFNDPGRSIVRLTYDRAAFDRAWASSGRTVYLVYPRQMVPPAGGQGRWLSSFDPDAPSPGDES